MQNALSVLIRVCHVAQWIFDKVVPLRWTEDIAIPHLLIKTRLDTAMVISVLYKKTMTIAVNNFLFLPSEISDLFM